MAENKSSKVMHERDMQKVSSVQKVEKIIVQAALYLFLGIIAILPQGAGMALGYPLTMGGSSLLIMVGVALETVKQIESQMLMRHYKGFLD